MNTETWLLAALIVIPIAFLLRNKYRNMVESTDNNPNDKDSWAGDGSQETKQEPSKNEEVKEETV